MKSKRQKVLAAAKMIIAEKGYHNASMKEIAGMAEVAQGTPYVYFKNKEDMFIQIIISFENDIDMIINNALEMDTDFWSRLKHIIGSLAHYLMKDRDITAILKEIPEPVGIGEAGKKQIVEIHKHREEKLHGIFMHLKGSTELNTGFTDKEAQRYCKTVLSGMIKRIENGEETDPEDTTEFMLKCIKETLKR